MLCYFTTRANLTCYAILLHQQPFNMLCYFTTRANLTCYAILLHEQPFNMFCYFATHVYAILLHQQPDRGVQHLLQIWFVSAHCLPPAEPTEIKRRC
jgi:L-rhamnose mutarotase